MDGAHGVLLSIAGGSDLGLFEINEAASLVQEAAHEDANIIFGTVIDDSLGDEVRVTVIAAGFDATPSVLPPTSTSVHGRRSTGNSARGVFADFPAGQPARRHSSSPRPHAAAAAPGTGAGVRPAAAAPGLPASPSSRSPAGRGVATVGPGRGRRRRAVVHETLTRDCVAPEPVGRDTSAGPAPAERGAGPGVSASAAPSAPAAGGSAGGDATGRGRIRRIMTTRRGGASRVPTRLSTSGPFVGDDPRAVAVEPRPARRGRRAARRRHRLDAPGARERRAGGRRPAPGRSGRPTPFPASMGSSPPQPVSASPSWWPTACRSSAGDPPPG